MADITMSINDVLELDAIIKEWNDPNNIVSDDDGSFNISGFQTNTSVLEPQQSGTHNITINGQTLTVKVIESSTIPDGAVHRFKFDEGSGTAYDSIGEKTIDVPDSAWIEDTNYQGGYAVDLSGISINTGERYSVFTNGKFTISSTLKLDIPSYSAAALEQHSEFVYGHDSNSGTGNLSYRVDPINFTDGISYTSNNIVRFTASTNMNDNTATLYKNGSSRSDNGGITDRNNNSNLIIGSGRDNNFRGIIDDLIIYDNTLTREEAIADYSVQPWS